MNKNLILALLVLSAGCAVAQPVTFKFLDGGNNGEVKIKITANKKSSTYTFPIVQTDGSTLLDNNDLYVAVKISDLKPDAQSAIKSYYKPTYNYLIVSRSGKVESDVGSNVGDGMGTPGYLFWGSKYLGTLPMTLPHPETGVGRSKRTDFCKGPCQPK